MTKAGRVFGGILMGICGAASLTGQDLRVGIVGDQTSSRDLAASYETLKKGIAVLREQKVAVLLHTGDLIESSRSEDLLRADFLQATGILDSLGRPWHLTPGDHDLNAAPFEQDSADRSREKIYRDLYRTREPALTDSLDHSFDIGGYHFIALNSQAHLHFDPRWGNVFLARIADEQIRWLAKDLETHRRSRGVVVFLHQPLWYNWGDWMRVHEVLRKYPVAAVVAGHFHYSQDEGSLDGIRYIVTGAAGGITKNANSRGATAPQVMVMTLSGRNASFQSLAIADGKAIPLMPRQAMDRLQALDIAVGQIDVSARSPVCVSGPELYSDYPARLPAKLNISAFGNPIDSPVRIDVAPASSGFSLKNPQFTAGACMALDQGNCLLRQSSRVAYSNNSGVQLDNRGAPLSVLWTSELAIQGPAPKAGEALAVKVRVSFDSAAGELFVERIAPVVVKDCSSAP